MLLLLKHTGRLSSTILVQNLLWSCKKYTHAIPWHTPTHTNLHAPTQIHLHKHSPSAWETSSWQLSSINRVGSKFTLTFSLSSWDDAAFQTGSRFILFSRVTRVCRNYSWRTQIFPFPSGVFVKLFWKPYKDVILPLN